MKKRLKRYEFRSIEEANAFIQKNKNVKEYIFVFKYENNKECVFDNWSTNRPCSIDYLERCICKDCFDSGYTLVVGRIKDNIFKRIKDWFYGKR